MNIRKLKALRSEISDDLMKVTTEQTRSPKNDESIDDLDANISGESGCNMSSSSEFSPMSSSEEEGDRHDRLLFLSPVAKKLDFSESDKVIRSPQLEGPMSKINDSDFSPPRDSPPTNTSSPVFKIPPSPYPPHRRLRALRLSDVPHTPRTLLEKSQRQAVNKRKADFENVNVNPFISDPSYITVINSKVKISPLHSVVDHNRNDLSLDDGASELFSPAKRICLRDINTSRYKEEFYQVSTLGTGNFGSVYKCISRIEGCVYAIKKSNVPVAGSAFEQISLNEVYAHAVLGKHPNVVRYFSAWAENDYMFIQNEFCNGGCLSDMIAENTRKGAAFTERECRLLLAHLTMGLKYIHSKNLAHLDIKPGNVFIHHEDRAPSSPESGMEDDSYYDDDETTDPVTYKIGDLGHVTSVRNPHVEEGDCRYLAKEVLQEDWRHLQKGDIFSLALTILEAAGYGELPKNDEEWHEIRAGNIRRLDNLSDKFHSLLIEMVRPDASQRPSAVEVLSHPALGPFSRKSSQQWRTELNEERIKNQVLVRKLKEIESKACFSAGRIGTRSRPFTFSKKFHRSVSGVF